MSASENSTVAAPRKPALVTGIAGQDGTSSELLIGEAAWCTGFRTEAFVADGS